MSIANPTTVLAPSDHGAGPKDNYLNHTRGFKSWAFTLDHKRIGLMYLVVVMSAFALGGVFALALRTLIVLPKPHEMGAQNARWDLYNNMFTLHGATMVFLFIIPSVPAILGNFILPMMLGAKDVAFPRLNLLSFYIYLLGAVGFSYILLSGVIHAAFGITLWGGFGLDTGWTFYTPYSSSKSGGQVFVATMAVFILGFSSILTGVNFVASIHSLRPRGMTWFRMPLFLWAIYGTSIIQILATPVLAITVLLLGAETMLKIGIFDPAYGGDPVLFQHFFWFYSHPAVYIMILPAMGIISEIISTFSRKHIFGYNFIAFSSIAIALLGFLVWGHHMFVSGQSSLANAFFSLITFAVAIPSAIKVFNWVGTMYKSAINFKVPVMYAMAFIYLFTIGGLTGLFLGALSVDVHVSATYFIVAHFHYVMMGSTLFAFIGGMYYWGPKMFGKMYAENFARVALVVVFVGMNLTFFPQFIAGSLGAPRRYAHYPEQFFIYHILSTCGAYTMGLGLVLVLCNWVHSLLYGKPAPANPWGANSLEWHTPSPPPHDNFSGTPISGDPYNLAAWVYKPDTEEWIIDPEKACSGIGIDPHKASVMPSHH